MLCEKLILSITDLQRRVEETVESVNFAFEEILSERHFEA